jgi:ubiquinone/menaquinone biosynthesis C-methylase UbiE
VTAAIDPEMGSPIRWARSYDLGMSVLMVGRGGAFRDRVLDLALLKQGEGLLDVGCGPGRLVMDACHRVGRLGAVCGVDISSEMVHLARKRARSSCPAADIRQAPAQELPFEDGFFDAVVSMLVIHHIDNDVEKRRAFSEMRRVLRGGGRLVIIDFLSDGGNPGLFSRAMSGHMPGGGAERYPALMRSSGFGRIDTGVAAMGVVRFVRGYAE